MHVISGVSASVEPLASLFESCWIMCALHVIFLPLPLLILTYRRIFRLRVRNDSRKSCRWCRHGYFYMNFAKILFVLGCDLSWFVANNISDISHGNYCVLTSCFMGSRIWLVQYWVNCQSQCLCECFHQSQNQHEKRGKRALMDSSTLCLQLLVRMYPYQQAAFHMMQAFGSKKKTSLVCGTFKLELSLPLNVSEKFWFQ